MLRVNNMGKKMWLTSVSVPYELWKKAKGRNLSMSSVLIKELEERIFHEGESRSELKVKLSNLADRLELACKDLERSKKDNDTLAFKIKFLEKKFMDEKLVDKEAKDE